MNKTNTKVTLRVPFIALSGLSEEELSLVRERLASRLDAEGNLYLSAREERSQAINREKALSRMEALIRAAAKRKPRRIPTRATRASAEKRIRVKKARSRTKNERRSPDSLE